LFGDFGADVILVEPDAGHALRHEAPFTEDGESLLHAYANWNKRSITESDEGLDDLVISADVVITTTVDLPECLELCREDVIHLSITPHGLTGPLAHVAGNNLTACARVGWSAINACENEPPLQLPHNQTGYIAGVAGFVSAAAALYRHIVDTVVLVSSTRVAEMVKLLENTFRAVNIGMVNELALMCRDLDVDVWEVIDAARTKPFGFMPFYPGPGLGGHCIPVDPFYLSWKARQHGFEPRFIELAGQVNRAMPRYVAERIAEALNTRSRALRGARVHLFGVAYKANVGDTRESPAIDIAALLQQQGALVSYTDPFVPFVNEGTVSLNAIAPAAALDAGIDCAVITTAHDGVDYVEVARRAPLVVDTRNVLRGVGGKHIFRL